MRQGDYTRGQRVWLSQDWYKVEISGSHVGEERLEVGAGGHSVIATFKNNLKIFLFSCSFSPFRKLKFFSVTVHIQYYTSLRYTT